MTDPTLVQVTQQVDEALEKGIQAGLSRATVFGTAYSAERAADPRTAAARLDAATWFAPSAGSGAWSAADSTGAAGWPWSTTSSRMPRASCRSWSRSTRATSPESRSGWRPSSGA